MQRTRVMALAMAGLTAAALSACAVSATPENNTGSGSKGSLTVASFGGIFQDAQIKAWQEPFTESTGVTFTNDAVDEPKLKAMVESKNVSWDVVDLAAGAGSQHCGKYLQKLDFGIIDKTKYPQETISDCGVPAYYYTQMFLYDTKLFGGNPPTKASDFFDLAKYPGKRIVPPEVSTGVLELALLADGVDKAHLYPLDIDRALAKLQTIKDQLVFADSYGQIQQALVGEQVAMALSVTGRTVPAIRGGAPYDVVWDGVVVNWDILGVPVGAPNSADAMKFIASVAEDKQQTDFALLSSTVPTNPDLKPAYDDVQKRLDPFADEHKGGLIYSDLNWWTENIDLADKKFTDWKVG